MALTEKKSFCRICGSACGIVVELDGEQVVKVRADVDHPITRGYTCPKGRALDQHHHQPNRLEYPMMRVDGVMQRASWDEVLDDLGGKLKRIIEESGPRGVGTFIGGGGYLEAGSFLSQRSFIKNVGTPSQYSDMTIDSVAKVISAELVCGIPGLSSRVDVERCKLAIFMGTNPVISHGQSWTLCSPTAAMRDMRARGTEIWVVDPRATETAARANHHIQPRPGTDYVIMGYLIRELLRDGADQQFIAEHSQGVEGLRSAVERFTLDHASALCGIDPQQLTDLLAAIRKAGRIAVDTGTGITMQRAGNVTQWLSWALMIITGSMDREGGSWISPGRLTRMDKMDIPPAPENGWNLPGPESRAGEARGIVGEYFCAAIPDEIAAKHLRSMIVWGGNLETCLPDTTRMYAALKDLEVLAVFDVRPTRTTDIASHILPVKDQLERADMTYVTDTYFPMIATQYTPAMVKPVGERRSTWWIIGQLGKRLGIDFYPGLDVDTADDDDVIRYILDTSLGDLTYEELTSERVVTQPPDIGWVQRYVDEKVGGWRLSPPPLADQLERLKTHENVDGPGSLVLIPRREKYHENSKMIEIEGAPPTKAMRNKPYVFLNPADAEEAGFAEGEKIEVRSVNGWIRREVKYDATLRKGVVNVPHGWSYEMNVNRLTGSREVDNLTGMVRYSGLEVTLHPLPDARSQAAGSSPFVEA